MLATFFDPMIGDEEQGSTAEIAAVESLPDAIAWAAARGFSASRIEVLPGDVSARRYVRLHGSRSDRSPATVVLALYPAELVATCGRFDRTTRLLTDTGIRVPAVLAADCAAGRMLLEDVGRRTLYDRRDEGWSALEPDLERAVEVVERLQSIPAEAIEGLNPPLGEELLSRELRQTWQVTLGSADLTEVGFSGTLETAFARLASELAAAPRAVAHRDLMARNLVPLDPSGGLDGLAVLDHQDLRLAPATYDLASLLNDSLYPPPSLEERLLEAVSVPTRRLDYHRAAAQRCLKIVGTFVGFARRGSERHLPLVAPSLERARRHLAALPEAAPPGSEVDDLLGALAEAARSA